MEFVNTTKEEDKISQEEGLYIFTLLMKKYCNNNIKDLDIVLNSLCAALIRLINLNVRKEDHESFIKIVNKILTKNLIGE